MKLKLQALVLLSISLFAALLHAPPASAQTHRGSVRGTVTDPNRAVIPGAEVTLSNRDTNETRVAMSDADGQYALSSLPPGRYVLDVTAAGFERMPQLINLQVNQELRVDIPMDVETQQVFLDAVLSSPPDLKKDSASLGAVIENRQVEGLPLDGRNFYELSLLVPGAAPPAQGSAGSVRGDFAFSVNGAREDANNFLLDGVYNVDPKLNTFGVRPPVDAIREFETLTSTYDASFGRIGRRAGQRRPQVGVERVSRLALRVPPQRRVWTRATSSRPRARPRPSTSATSSASRSAAPSGKTAPSSSPTTKARARAKASRASPTSRRSPNARATSRSRSTSSASPSSSATRSASTPSPSSRSPATRRINRAASPATASPLTARAPSGAPSPRSTRRPTARRPSPTSSRRPRSATATTASTRA